MAKTRVALVRPPVSVLRKFSKAVENLAIAYLATALRKDWHDVVMLDGMLLGWTVDETVEQILDTKPDLIGFTVVLQYFPPSLQEIIVKLREAGYGGVILVGGHSVSFFADRIVERIPELDAVICGEGEFGLRMVAEALAQGGDWHGAPGLCWIDEHGEVRQNGARRVRDLEEVGDAARDLTPAVMQNDGLVAISSSRGCYARCSFCSIPRFYGLEGGRALRSGDWIGRSVASTAAEVASLHDRFDVCELLFVDDEFFGGNELGLERALALGRRLEDLAMPLEFALSCRAENVDARVFEQLRRGGLRHVFVGIETGSDKVLKLYGKQHTSAQNRLAVQTIKSLGLTFQPGFMLFNYRSTVAELKQSLEFLLEIDECKPVTINSGVDPHFGTPLLADMARRQQLDDRGLTMRAGYADRHVAAIKVIAERCVEEFLPYMEFLAGVRSAVTYEWRRRLAHRRPAEEQLLDVFEANVNRSFANVVIHAVDRALANPGCEPFELIADANGEIEGMRERLALSRALVVTQLVEVEGGIFYVTQLDLISECQARLA